MNEEDNAYILGTDDQELYRLGLQHQIWAGEAHRGWNTAKFNAGQTILDLGCGPGFCTRELAYITGPTGKVIAVDKSAHYLNYLQKIITMHNFSIETIQCDIAELALPDQSLDGMFCRWVLAWVSEPEKVLRKVFAALKPGAKMVIHEYYDWSTHQTEPNKSHLTKAIKAALQSFKESDSEIDIGRELPVLLAKIGMQNIEFRTMSKIARPNEATWQWPKSFYKSYFPHLVEMKYLTENDFQNALEDLHSLEANTNSAICCPLMSETIATK